MKNLHLYRRVKLFLPRANMYLPSETVHVHMLINILDFCCLERPEPCEKSMLIIPPNAAAEAVRELGGEKNIK